MTTDNNIENIFNGKKQQTKTAPKKNEIQKAEGTENAPAWLTEYNSSDANMDIDQDDITIPRLKLIQSQTVEDFNGKPGEIVNMATGKNYGTSIEVIPVVQWKSRVKFNDDFSVDCMSMDGRTSAFSDESFTCKQCENSKWGADRTPPACNLIYCYGVIPTEEIETGGEIIPAVLSLMRSNTKTAKQLNASLFSLSQQGKPIFARTIKIKSVERKFAKGKAFVLEAVIGRYITLEEAKRLKMLSDQYKKAPSSVAPEVDQDEMRAIDDVPF